MTSGSRRLPRPGEVLAGRYRIDSAMARGGMGVVYDGRDLELGRPVAIKVLPPFVRADNARQRFLRECQLTASIDHPNVIRIYDAGFDSGLAPYFVMERLEGTTLGRWVKGHGALALRPALQVTLGVCAALEAAHARDVLHRDVKPANVFLTAPPRERVVLFDFGLSLEASRRTRITDHGVLVGTPAYMAPEQVLGKTVDARTDVYGAGTVAYRVLTGHRHIPKDSTEVGQVFDAVVHGQPKPIREHVPEVPAEVEALVMRALEKSPDERFQSAAEMRDAIREVLDRLAA